MPYHNLPETIAYCEFVEIRVLIRLVIEARRIPYSVKAERDRTRELFNTMHRVEVSVDRRFPVLGRYANVTTGPVADLLDKLIFGLDENERGLDREQAMGAPQKFNSINDAKLAYLKICQKLLQLLTSSASVAFMYGVYTYDTFEGTYALQWIDEEQEQPQQQQRPVITAQPPPPPGRPVNPAAK